MSLDAEEPNTSTQHIERLYGFCLVSDSQSPGSHISLDFYWEGITMGASCEEANESKGAEVVPNVNLKPNPNSDLNP